MSFHVHTPLLGDRDSRVQGSTHATIAIVMVLTHSTQYSHMTLTNSAQGDECWLYCTGVQLMPFHVNSTSLPELPGAQWESLIQSSSTKRDRRENVATLLLSEPHFLQVIAHHC